jgi:hypothetical protein
MFHGKFSSRENESHRMGLESMPIWHLYHFPRQSRQPINPVLREGEQMVVNVVLWCRPSGVKHLFNLIICEITIGMVRTLILLGIFLKVMTQPRLRT